jgi:hypothetical protein
MSAGLAGVREVQATDVGGLDGAGLGAAVLGAAGAAAAGTSRRGRALIPGVGVRTHVLSEIQANM